MDNTKKLKVERLFERKGKTKISSTEAKKYCKKTEKFFRKAFRKTRKKDSTLKM